MATIWDYIFPQIMGAGRAADEFSQRRDIADKKQALETLSVLANKPDTFEGVSGVPTQNMMDLWRQGTGEAWPMAQNEQTGAPPPGLQEPVPGLASNMPTETLAVMRSPISQSTNEMTQKGIAKAMADIKSREATLGAQGNLPERELQSRIGTLGSVLGPAGYTPTDIGAGVMGRYPLEKQKELLTARGDTSLSTPELALKAAGGDAGKALELIAKTHRSGLKEGGTGAGQEKVPPKVKAAQDFVKRVVSMASGQMNPTMAILVGMNPEMASSPAVQQAMKGVQLPPELKATYDASVKIIEAYYGATPANVEPVGQDTIGTTSGPAATGLDWRNFK